MVDHSFVDDVPDASHLCQFYSVDDGAGLATNVARYIADGIANNSTVIIVCTEENKAAFSRELLKLEVDVQRSLGPIFLDAHDMLGQFMVAGHPDPVLFEAHIGSLVRDVYAPDCGLRIYGEMVGVLWSAGQHSAALRLEQLWNTLQRDVPFRLYCGYPIDVLSKEFEVGAVEAIVCAHSRLLPSTSARRLEGAVARAMDEMLGQKVPLTFASDAVFQSRGNTPIPVGEALIFWLHDRSPAQARTVLARARDHFQDQL